MHFLLAPPERGVEGGEEFDARQGLRGRKGRFGARDVPREDVDARRWRRVGSDRRPPGGLIAAKLWASPACATAHPIPNEGDSRLGAPTAEGGVSDRSTLPHIRSQQADKGGSRVRRLTLPPPAVSFC